MEKAPQAAPETDEVLIEEKGITKTITLNRPKQLNALTLPMIKKITPYYKKWEKEKAVIIMKGVGKAFCAGGDIRAIYDAGKRKEFGQGTLTFDFFFEEYNLNFLIARARLENLATQVSLLNGVTMGGGAGLSVHGKYRVATENAVFAMPETAIGFFTDVGMTYFLGRLPKHLGMYLALTGERLKGAELVAAGIATHYVPSEKLAELEQSLAGVQGFEVGQILAKFHQVPETPEVPEIVRMADAIDKVFEHISIRDIWIALEKVSTTDADPAKRAWATKTMETLTKMSPISLTMTQSGLRMSGAPGRSFMDAFQLEFNMTQKFVKRHDFYEGVRAQLVDKDRNPKWDPASIQDKMDWVDLNRYFFPGTGGVTWLPKDY